MNHWSLVVTCPVSSSCIILKNDFQTQAALVEFSRSHSHCDAQTCTSLARSLLSQAEGEGTPVHQWLCSLKELHVTQPVFSNVCHLRPAVQTHPDIPAPPPPNWAQSEHLRTHVETPHDWQATSFSLIPTQPFSPSPEPPDKLLQKWNNQSSYLCWGLYRGVLDGSERRSDL